MGVNPLLCKFRIQRPATSIDLLQFFSQVCFGLQGRTMVSMKALGLSFGLGLGLGLGYPRRCS